MPSVLKTFLGEWNTMLQTEHWAEGAEGEYLNELEMSGEGVPADMHGSMVLRPTKQGCVNEVEITIKAHVPLVGRKLEEFVAKGAAAQLAAEYDFIRKYLAAGSWRTCFPIRSIPPRLPRSRRWPSPGRAARAGW